MQIYQIICAVEITMNTSQENINTWKNYRNSTENIVLDDSLEECLEEVTNDFEEDEIQESFILDNGHSKSANDNEAIIDMDDDNSEDKSMSDLHGNTDIFKDKEEDNDSAEDIPDYSGAVFTSESGIDINRAALFLGVTSGSFLTGFSIGWFLAARENQSWLSSAVSNIVVRKVWQSMHMVIITGLMGTSILGFSSFRFWTKKDEKEFDDF